MGFFAHPAAGAFGGWQAGNHKGAELVNEPVSLAWNTLVTPDTAGATDFLRIVFGLRTETQRIGHQEYLILLLGEDGVAGLMGPPPGMPEGVPAFWGVSFAVEDTDATAALAVERGGSMLLEPFDMAGVGRIATVTDPWGALFSVVALE
jgi:predicted enzyme related to lactoylglutathione lyase